MKGLESVNKNIGEREKVKGSRCARHYVLDALNFDLQYGQNVDFLCLDMIKHDFSYKPSVGNLSKGLESVEDSDRERKKVRGRRFT